MQVWSFRVSEVCLALISACPRIFESWTHLHIQGFLSNIIETCFYLYISTLCLLAVGRLHVRFLLRFKQLI